MISMKNRKKDLDLLKGSISKLILQLTAPMMVSTLIRNSYFFIDMAFAAFLGGVQIASVAVVSPLINTLNSMGMGITNGGVGVIAKAIGEGDSEKASKYAVQLRIVILLVASVITLIGVIFTMISSNFISSDGELLSESLNYSKIMFFSLPFTMISSFYMTLYQSQGKMNITTKMTLITFIGNTVFNATFLLVFKMGIEGLAYGTLLTKIIQMFIIIRLYNKETHQFTLPYAVFTSRLNIPIMKDLLKVGLPLSFSMSSTSFGFFLCNLVIAPYGYEVVAGYAIGNRINTFFYGTAQGFGKGTVPLVAQNVGNRNLTRVKEIINKNILYAGLYGILGVFGLMLIIPPLSQFLAKDNEIILRHVVNYTRLMSWGMIPWSLFQCMAGVFTGLQKTMITMSITAVRLWALRIPGIIVFYKFFSSFAEYGVWYTMFYSNLLTALFALLLYIFYIPKYIERLLDR